MAVTLDSLKKTVGKKKVKSMAFAWLADYENTAGDTDNALARVDGGLQLYPGDIPGMLVRSKILFQKGDFEECVKECERILEKEPFCLSAQKRMGEAYEQLEDIDNRNRCFRRVHDMDPLDTFWKDEYDAVSDTAAAGVAAAAAGEAALDSEFAMPDMGEFNAEAPAESAEPAVEASAGSAAEVPETEEDSLFSKSLDMDIESPAEAPAAPEEEATEEQPKQYASPFSSAADDDPFAALASLGSDDNSVEESAMDSLQQSLESAMGAEATDVTLDQEIPEGQEISGNDVDSAFSSLFGDDDDLDSFGETAESKPASPFAQMDLPTSLEDEAETKEDSAKNVFGEEAVEDKPQSIDDAFGDIFGEDELPEELPPTQPVNKADAAPSEELAEETKPEEESSFGGLFEKSAAAAMGFGTVDDALALNEPAPEESAEEKPAQEESATEPQESDKPLSVDDAFADIFGEDELPEELPPAQPAHEDNAAPAEEAKIEDSLDLPEDLSLDMEEKPAEPSDVFDLSAWSPDAKPVAELPAEEKLEEESLELPAEVLPAEEKPAEELQAEDAPALVSPADELALDEPVPEASLELPAEEHPAEEQPAEELQVEDAPALVSPADELALEEPAPETPAEPALDMPAEPAAEEEGFSVDKAFDALFAEEDELPEEKTAASSVEPEITDNVSVPAEEASASAEEVATESSDIDKEVGAAFGALFAEDDDLPVEETQPAAAVEEPTPEDTGAEIEEAPLADAALESDLDKSFSSLFGEDDSLDESDLKPASAPAEETAAEPAAEMTAQEDAPAAEVNHSDADSLESEFSGAFKQLFNTDDDSLDEKADLPSNKGVDFLMSGDSDDEVTARLVSDPNASLDKLPSDLDDSLNTPTLAEIYFEQGLYKKALDIYQDLAQKDPENETLTKRLAEVEAAYRSKSGGDNG